MSYLPTIRQLQYLVALAELKSFSRAAARCHVTQSTFSAGIATMEKLLGQKMVDRSRRGVVLTPLGLETAARAQSVLRAADDLAERARRAASPLSGPLRLGVIPTVAPYLLPQLIPAVQKNFPKLELQIREDLSQRLVQRLRNGDCDLVLMAFPYEAADLQQTILFHENFVLAAPRGQWRKKGALKNEDLRDSNLLLLEEGHCLRDHALAACALRPAQEQQAFSATSLTTLIQMVQHGYGMTLLPAMAARQLPAKIETFPFKKPAPGRQIGLAWRRNSPRDGEFLQLARALKTAFH